MSTESNTPRTDAEEAKRRAEWLHRNNAPFDWVVLTIDEVAQLRDELARVAELEREIERNAWTLSPEMVQTRNDQLAAENEALEQRNAELVAALRDARDDYAALRRPVDVARVDALLTPAESAAPAVVKESFTTESATPAKHPDTERLDWLESQKADVFETHNEWYVAFGERSSGPTIRAAIDAARKQGGPTP